MKKVKQIAAIIAIVLLVALYVTTFIVALTSPVGEMKLFGICLFGTVAIPILAFAFIYVYGRTYNKKIMGDPEKETDSTSQES